MAKKTDKAVDGLAREIKKLRKGNEKLAKTLEKTREDQAESHREILALLEERLTARDAGTTEAEDHVRHNEPEEPPAAETAQSRDEEVSETSLDGQQDRQEEPEVTEAAERRAKDLGVDLSTVKGSGSGGRVLVKDVEAAADGSR